MERLYFIEKDHSYWGVDSGLRYTAVSNVAKKYEAKVDWDQMLINSAKKKGVSPEDLKKEWDRKKEVGTTVGTFVHEGKEKKRFETGYHILTRDGDPYDVCEVVPYEMDGDKKLQIMEVKPGYAYPELIVSLQKDHLRIGGQSDDIFIDSKGYVNVSDWKGLSLDTDIPTPSGFVKMGDIKEGDDIFDGVGEVTKVRHVSELHYNPCFKITFDTGDTIVCDHEHRWEVLIRNKSTKWTERILTTDELLQFMGKRDVSVRIPCVKTNPPKKDLPIDPYVLGQWIADGNRCCSVICCSVICCQYGEIWDEIESRGYKTSIDHNRNNSNMAEQRTVLGIRGHLINLNLLKNKHVPNEYLTSSYEQRLDLLRGIMDGDGYFNRARKRCVIDTTNEYMADEYMVLISSLGFKPTKIKAKATGFGKTVDRWDVCFTPNISPFLIRNKDYTEVIKNSKLFTSKNRQIKSIGVVDTVPTRCISVESPFKTYLATKHFIKTHNTDKSIDRESFYNYRTGYQMLSGPLSRLMACNLIMYSIKMSLYMYFILKANPDLKAGDITLVHLKLKRDKDKVPILVDGKPTILGEEDIPINYNEFKPFVQDLLNDYYKVTKPKKK